MVLDQRKYERKHTDVLRDIRPAYVRAAEWFTKPNNSAAVFFMTAFLLSFSNSALMFADFIFFFFCAYFLWLVGRDRTLAYKMPAGAKWLDKNNEGPGRGGKAEGILYLGNVKDTNEEVWFTNSDARTHVLYLGTTGSGKTEGLKSMVTNAMTWSSGFVYVDGKADTDLWSSLSSLVRRFGRDDDLLVLNYMTGNSDIKAPSNTMNPFSSGSASYLTNMLVSLMPDAGGDNAMWKERAVALVASLMPALTWKRDNQDIPMSIGTIRDYMNLNKIISLSRDQTLPEDIAIGVKGYLDTLPGYVDAAYDDDGNEKPPGPDQPQHDTSTASQQHGYLSMQFTRALQSLADEYGYIFDTQAADVDMVDVVLNRRILVVLIPALEKSSDETANLGKIVAATIKGMMGSTLGSTVEGESSTVIENKPTNSATPFMVVFDEVGYYTAEGMAVMAAQARSLGFSLIYSAQDLPALEKRIKEEARSITANCNIKIFGKLEDPTQTKEFFEKTVGSAIVIEASGFQRASGGSTGSYSDSQQAAMQIRPLASYEELKGFKEGEAVMSFGTRVCDTAIFYSNPGHAKAMRVTRYIALPPADAGLLKNAPVIGKLRDLMVHKTWTVMKADVAIETPIEIKAMADAIADAKKKKVSDIDTGKIGVIGLYALNNEIEEEAAQEVVQETKAETPATTEKPAEEEKPADKPAQAPKEGTSKEDNKPADDSSNPMSFFSGKKTDDSAGDDTAEKDKDPEKDKTADADKKEDTNSKGPINWEDLIAQEAPKVDVPDTTTAPAATQSKPPEDTRDPLDPESAKIMKEAGEKARDSLFKKQPPTDGDPEDAEAAE